jgi:transketolase
MALALRLDRRTSRVYVILGDGELSEGQVWEAAMAAPAFGLDSITAILDANGIQATAPTAEVLPIPDVEDKWRSFGWNVRTVDGHDIGSILDELERSAAVKGKPSLIVADTVKGKGVSFAENTAAFHNAALTREQYELALSEIDSRLAAHARAGE